MTKLPKDEEMPVIDPENLKRRIALAIKSGAMWANKDGLVTTSVFDLALSLQRCGVDCAEANSLPAVNAVFIIDGPQLLKFFGDTPIPGILQRSDTAKRFV